MVYIYIPPPCKNKVLKQIAKYMARWPTLPVLVMGDFSNVLNEGEDRFNTAKVKGKEKKTRFAKQLQEIGLIDVWKLRHPTAREYSCCSSTYGFFSRTDLALGSDNLLPWLNSIQYGPRGLSDHSPITLRLWAAILLIMES